MEMSGNGFQKNHFQMEIIYLQNHNLERKTISRKETISFWHWKPFRTLKAMISATHQTYYHYFCKGKVRVQEMVSATHQTYYHHFCKGKVRVQEMICATHQTYYQ